MRVKKIKYSFCFDLQTYYDELGKKGAKTHTFFICGNYFVLFYINVSIYVRSNMNLEKSVYLNCHTVWYTYNCHLKLFMIYFIWPPINILQVDYMTFYDKVIYMLTPVYCERLGRDVILKVFSVAMYKHSKVYVLSNIFTVFKEYLVLETWQRLLTRISNKVLTYKIKIII